MRHTAAPTSEENAPGRLFLRFFLLYVTSASLAFLLLAPALPRLPMSEVGAVEWLFVPLALLGALLTVSSPYLALLTVAKAVYDAAILYRVTHLARSGAVGFLLWNACFFLLAFSLTLTAFAASRACFFAHRSPRRDAALLLSRPFLCYLGEALVLTAFSSVLYPIWVHVAALLAV